MAEEILIDIKLEKSDNDKQVDELTKAITGLAKANEELKKQNKELAKTGQENSKEYIENSKQIEINKQKITESQAARKGLIQAIIAEDNSIKALQIQNANLIKQRNQLNLSTEEGRTRIAAINAQLDKNNETIAKNVSALEKQKINIGNYKSALDGLVPGLGKVVDGIDNGTKAARTFIATPIGAVIGALGLAIAALTAYFKGSEEGQDRLAKITAVLGVALNKVMVVVEAVGEAIFDGAAGFGTMTEKLGIFGVALDVTLAPLKLLLLGLQKISEITGFDKIVEDTIKTGEAIADLNDEIEANENELIVKRAQTNAKVQALREKAIKEEGKLKAETIAEAIRLEKELAALEKKQLEDKLKAFDLEAATTGRLTEEQKKQRAELVAAIINAEAEGAASTIRFQKELERLNDAQIANIEKAQKAKEKAAADEKKRQEKEIEDKKKARAEELKLIEDQGAAEKEQFETNSKVLEDQQTEDLNREKEKLLAGITTKEEYEAKVSQIELDALLERKAFLEANGMDTLAIETAIIDKKLAIKQKELASEKTIDAARLANDRAVTNAKLGLAAQAGQVLQQLAGKSKGLAIAGVVIEKAAALGQIAANTAVANSKALASSPLTGGMPWVAINTASAILSGLSVVAEAAQSISQINSAKFARGGIARTGGVLRGPLHRNGGIPFSVGGVAGFEAEGNEAIINRRSTAMFRPLLSAINEAGGGVKFAGGGMTTIGNSQTRIASASAISQSGIRELTQAVLNRPVKVTVEDINAKQAEVFTTEQRAQVI